jgi:hypothetical protein
VNVSDRNSTLQRLGSLDFRGNLVSVYTDSRGSWVFPGQICARMGIDPNAQRQSIERNSWSEGWTCVTHVQTPGDVQPRPHFLLHERRLPMWIATITASRLQDPEVRARVEEWQNEFADVLYDYLVHGGVINPDATHAQIEALHARIAEIRASEKHAHRKLTDLIVETASDYDRSNPRVQMFFAQVQNILLYAASKHIASELKMSRQIVCYEGVNGPTKRDLGIAKNYLSEQELRILEKFVGVFFDLADIRTMGRDDVTLAGWQEMLNQAIRTAGRPVLADDRPWMFRYRP